jgi:hypothetical protein
VSTRTARTPSDLLTARRRWPRRSSPAADQSRHLTHAWSMPVCHRHPPRRLEHQHGAHAMRCAYRGDLDGKRSLDGRHAGRSARSMTSTVDAMAATMAASFYRCGQHGQLCQRRPHSDLHIPSSRR